MRGHTMSFHPSRRAGWLACLALAVSVPAARVDGARPLEFHVTFDRAVSAAPFTGRLYVMLSARKNSEPRSGPNWLSPEPFFAIDVKDWKPGTPAVVSSTALGCPAPLDKLKKGSYSIQAVMDLDRGGRHFSLAPGNGYSKPLWQELDPSATGPVRLTIDQVVKETSFKETPRVKLVDIESKLLTAFHGRPMHMRAGVVLPKAYKEGDERRYAVVYEVPGFGGNHFMAFGRERSNITEVAGIGMIWVVLDP